MIRLLLALLLLLATPAWAVPAKVQHIATSNTDTVTLPNPTTLHWFLGKPTQAGNCLVMALFLNGGTTVTTAPHDNQGQNWTASKSFTTGTNANAYVYTFTNTAAGVQSGTVVLSTANTFSTYTISEWSGVDTTNCVTAANAGEGLAASTAWTTGAQTSANNDTFYCAFDSTVQPYTATNTWTKSAGATSHSRDRAEGLYSESKTAAGASTTCAPTAPTSATWVWIDISIKAGAGGTTDPNALTPVNFQNTTLISYGTGTSITVDFPCTGNTVLMANSVSPNSGVITAMSNFTAKVNADVANGNGGTVQMWYAKNVSCSDTFNTALTLATNGPVGGLSMWFVDIAGADTTTPVDAGTLQTNSNNQLAAGDITVFTLTPGTGTQLCFGYLDHASRTDASVTSSSYNMVIPNGEQDGTSGGNWAMDSGFAWGRLSSGVALTFSRTAGGSAAGLWEATGGCIKAAAAGGSKPFIPEQYFPSPMGPRQL